MAVSRRRIPKHCHHKASNRGVVRLNGVDHYTGPWASLEAEAEYERVVAEWLANGRTLPLETKAVTSQTTIMHAPTISELILRFWRHAEIHYRHADGTPTSELSNYRQSLRLLRHLYGDEPVSSFSPSKLKAIRELWVAGGICRQQINLRAGRVKRVFKWGVSEELVPVGVWQALSTVQGLQANRSLAVESQPVEPVSDEHVSAVLPFLRPQVKDMVELQRLTGMRPGEVCQFRWREIDRTTDIWGYRPARHKTAWRGKERVVFIGPKAQEVLKRYIKHDAGEYLFSPREAVDQLHRERGEQRITRYYESRQGWQKPKANPKRKPKARYTVSSYGQAIRRACRKAEIPAWKPNQLRHSTGTKVRKTYGIEAAQVILGHSKADVTQVYAERDHELAQKIAAEIG